MINETNIARADSRGTCAHDYVRSDSVCAECGERAPPTRSRARMAS